MSHASDDPMLELLAQSLIAWRIAGSVRRTGGGAILLRAGQKEIRIEPAPNNLPFRWMVWKIFGTLQDFVSIVASQFFGRIRGRLSIRPPPVM